MYAIKTASGFVLSSDGTTMAFKTPGKAIAHVNKTGISSFGLVPLPSPAPMPKGNVS